LEWALSGLFTEITGPSALAFDVEVEYLVGIHRVAQTFGHRDQMPLDIAPAPVQVPEQRVKPWSRR